MASKYWHSRWIKAYITLAYWVSSLLVPFCIMAHSTRVPATAHTIRTNAPLNGPFRAATRSYPTSIRHNNMSLILPRHHSGGRSSIPSICGSTIPPYVEKLLHIPSFRASWEKTSLMENIEYSLCEFLLIGVWGMCYPARRTILTAALMFYSLSWGLLCHLQQTCCNIVFLEQGFLIHRFCLILLLFQLLFLTGQFWSEKGCSPMGS